MEEFKEYVIVMVALAGPQAGTVLRRYRTPDSRHFGGLVEVIRHLADSKDTPELDAGLEKKVRGSPSGGGRTGNGIV